LFNTFQRLKVLNGGGKNGIGEYTQAFWLSMSDQKSL